jgi:hypothetical protein
MIFKLNFLRPVIAALFVFILVCTFAVPVQAADPVVTTSFTTASDGHTHVWGSTWASENFTTGATTEYTVTSVRLYMSVVGTPAAGNLNVEIRKTSAGLPTGVAIASGSISVASISASAWYDVPVTAEKGLELNTTYSIVASALTGTATNGIVWEKNTAAAYTGWYEQTSTNSGTTWSSVAPQSTFLFQLMGNPTLAIEDVKVFQGYRATGDWLVVCRYINTFVPYYPNQDIKRYFSIQLVDNVTVLTSNSITEWGNRAGSIYLSAAQVTPYTWGGAYKVRIQGLFTGSPYVDYSLVGADWVGTDLTQLDSWALTSAKTIQTYDTAQTGIAKTYTTNIATRGTVLTASGGDILSQGIPGLSTVRPQIFQIYTVGTAYVPQTGTATMANTVRSGTAAAIGPDAVAAFGDFGTDVMGGLAYNQVIALIAVILAFGLAAATFPFGHTTAANVLCIGVVFAFGYFGFDWVWIGMIYAVSVFLLAKKLWIDTGM